MERTRMTNALWGLFVGDALAMPVHWYYDVGNIEKDFDGGISGYEAPRHPHPEAFMVGMNYQPDVLSAHRLDRPFDILHEHARFYNASYSPLTVDRIHRESEHGNLVARLEDRFHYHHGLKAGENTVGAHLVRVLMRSVTSRGRYDDVGFLEDFVRYLTTPGRTDPYLEVYIRRWFEKYATGRPLRDCAELQRNVWSIGSHGGMIRPLVLSMLLKGPYQAVGFAHEHANLTHRSEIVAEALGICVPLLFDLLGGADPAEAMRAHGAHVRAPKVTGEELFAEYRAARGPGNIPREEMWLLHTDRVDEPFDAAREVAPGRFASACYPEHGLPLMLHLAMRNGCAFEASLLANANEGGDNVHRGMVLGLLVGAASRGIPSHLLRGLTAFDELKPEIDAYVDLALAGTAV